MRGREEDEDTVDTQTPAPDSGAPAASAPAPAPAPPLRRRESSWLQRRCARLGHVLAHLDDPVATALRATGPDGPLLRCLRCGGFHDPATLVRPGQVLGTAGAPVPLAQVPQVLRGAHGRKLALLRLLAVERGSRGALLLVAAAGIARLASSHVAVAEWLGRMATAAQPLGAQIGWDVLRSSLIEEAQRLLGHSGGTYLTVAWLIAGYGATQVVEGVGLWGGWRWAEYLAAIATSAFVPLEGYELLHHPSVFKAGALAVNLVAVAYLVYKGRLFGARGGHPAYLAEVREATLLADLLRAAGRPTEVLAGQHLA